MRRTLIIFFAILALATFATHVSADDYDYEDYDYEDGDYEECDSWESDWSSNRRWVGGTSVGTKSASSVAKCGDLCIESDDCYTFNFFKGKCYMYEDDEDDLDTKSAKGYSAGYVYCDDKKKK